MKKEVNRKLNPVSEEEIVITASDAHWLNNDHIHSIASWTKKIEKHFNVDDREYNAFKTEFSTKHTSEVRKLEMAEQLVKLQDYRRYELRLLLSKANYQNLKNAVFMKKFIAYTRSKEESLNN